MITTQPKVLTRRNILGGLAAIIAAPAIIRYGNLMPVRSVIEPLQGFPRIAGVYLGPYDPTNQKVILTGYDQYGYWKVETVTLTPGRDWYKGDPVLYYEVLPATIVEHS